MRQFMPMLPESGALRMILAEQVSSQRQGPSPWFNAVFRQDEGMQADKTTIRHDTTQRHIGKYANRNPVHYFVLGRFLDAVADRLRGFETKRSLDFGCGEALFWSEMRNRNVLMQNLLGIDLRADALATATRMFPEHKFLNQDLLEWEPEEKFDLVVASQVLEHLPEPERFLEKLVSITKPEGTLLLTVPWEPFFRLSNFARGRDMLRFGNHPEHVNLWGAKSFRQFVSRYANVRQLETILPFTMVLASPL